MTNDFLGSPEIMGSRTVVFRIVRLPYLVWVEGRGIKNTLAKKVLVDSVDTQSHDPLLSSSHSRAGEADVIVSFRFLFSWAPKSLQMVTSTMKLKDACSLEEKL